MNHKQPFDRSIVIQLLVAALVLGTVFFASYKPLLLKLGPQPIDTLIVKETYVYFGIDSDSLSIESYPVLKAIGSDTNRVGVLKVIANADSTGTKEHNLALSKKRAWVVTATLVEFGVKPDSIATLGLGDFKPLSTNTTEQGRQLNRSAIVRYTIKERIFK